MDQPDPGGAAVNALVPVLASLVAVAAAVRSTWSPCGLSMLSTITPFSERARGHRYGVTAGWFVVGSVLGGATLGVAAAGLAAVLAAVGSGAGPGWPAVLVAVAAAGGAALDAGVFGPVIPLWRRQVDDGWLGRYRGWAYGVGFGWQIGTGLATYIMTAAVFVMVVAAAASRDPFVAWMVCVGFGLVRGSAVLLTARASTPARLRDLHRRFSLVGPPVRGAVIGVQVAVAAVAVAAAVWGRDGAVGWWALLAVIVAVAGAAIGVAAASPVPAGSVRRRRATTGLAAVAVAAVALSLAAGGCGSSGHQATSVGAASASGPTSPATAPPTTAAPTTVVPTTVAGQVPTVPDCGGGAYRPQTLLIVCGRGTTMATDVTWDAWGASSAAGVGTVHLEVGGRPASATGRLVLDMVAGGPVGPQFRRLTVTWTGPSPDGHSQDTYRLAAGA